MTDALRPAPYHPLVPAGVLADTVYAPERILMHATRCCGRYSYTWVLEVTDCARVKSLLFANLHVDF
jgi:hypothetical protein